MENKNKDDVLLKTLKRAKQYRSTKYKVDQQFHNDKAMEDILFNKKSISSHLYKEMLLDNEIEEALKKYYLRYESCFLLDRLYTYYTSNFIIFPNINKIFESKYILKNLHNKQKRMGDNEKAIKNNNNLDQDERDNLIFTEDVIKLILDGDVYQEKEVKTNLAMNDTVKNNPDDSLSEIYDLIHKLKFFSVNKNCDNFEPRKESIHYTRRVVIKTSTNVNNNLDMKNLENLIPVKLEEEKDILEIQKEEEEKLLEINLRNSKFRKTKEFIRNIKKKEKEDYKRGLFLQEAIIKMRSESKLKSGKKLNSNNEILPLLNENNKLHHFLKSSNHNESPKLHKLKIRKSVTFQRNSSSEKKPHLINTTSEKNSFLRNKFIEVKTHFKKILPINISHQRNKNTPFSKGSITKISEFRIPTNLTRCATPTNKFINFKL